MALSPFAFGAELVVCQRCSGRTAEKDGGDGKMQQQEVQVKESRWVEEIPQRHREVVHEKR